MSSVINSSSLTVSSLLSYVYLSDVQWPHYAESGKVDRDPEKRTSPLYPISSSHDTLIYSSHGKRQTLWKKSAARGNPSQNRRTKMLDG